MDLTMPGIDGIEATRQIVDATPHVAVLVLTMSDDDDSVFAAIQAGARGYLLKDAAGDDLLRSIDTVGHGGAVFGPGVARRLVAFFASGGVGPRAEPFPELTERERQVLRLAGEGRSSGDIARQVHLSEGTVRNYLSEAISKLGAANRIEAYRMARDAGWL